MAVRAVGGVVAVPAVAFAVVLAAVAPVHPSPFRRSTVAARPVLIEDRLREVPPPRTRDRNGQLKTPRVKMLHSSWRHWSSNQFLRYSIPRGVPTMTSSLSSIPSENVR